LAIPWLPGDVSGCVGGLDCRLPGMVWYGMVWYGMVWYGYRKTKDAKVLKNHMKKPKMQRFSKTIRKNQRCKGSQKPYEKTKDAKVLKYHDKNTITKKKTNSCIFTLFNIYNYFTKKHTKKQGCKGSQNNDKKG